MKRLIIFVFISLGLFAENYEIRVNHGFLQGVGNEYVYKDNQGTKLSELIWNLESVKLIGMGFTYGTERPYSINADFYANYMKSTSDMDDYDWVLPISDWTHWSNSPTDINGVYKLDVNLQYKIPLNSFSLLFLAGYKYDVYKWVASGGTYVYSDDDGSNFRGYKGNLPDTPGISYNQFFTIPYIGVGASLGGDSFSIESKLLYSSAVSAKDEDTHHLRDLFFEDIFEEGTFIQVNLLGKYKLTDSIGINGSYIYEEHLVNKGYTVTTDLTDGSKDTSGYGAAGIANKVSTISLGLNYNF